MAAILPSVRSKYAATLLAIVVISVILIQFGSRNGTIPALPYSNTGRRYTDKLLDDTQNATLGVSL